MSKLLKSLNNTEGNGIDGILPQAPGQLAGSGDSEPAAQFVENEHCQHAHLIIGCHEEAEQLLYAACAHDGLFRNVIGAVAG